MSCPYSQETLDEWEDVVNPMGKACNGCDDCECIHWLGSCVDCDREDCPDPDRALVESMNIDELRQTFGGE